MPFTGGIIEWSYKHGSSGPIREDSLLEVFWRLKQRILFRPLSLSISSITDWCHLIIPRGGLPLPTYPEDGTRIPKEWNWICVAVNFTSFTHSSSKLLARNGDLNKYPIHWSSDMCLTTKLCSRSHHPPTICRTIISQPASLSYSHSHWLCIGNK